MSKPLDVKAYAIDLRTSALNAIAKFTKDFAENPRYALEWRCPHEAAANLDVAGYIIQWHERGAELGADEANVNAAVIQHAMGEVIRLAERMNQSTSPIANLLERATMAAWSQLAGKAFNKARFTGDDMTVIFKAVPSAAAGKED